MATSGSFLENIGVTTKAWWGDGSTHEQKKRGKNDKKSYLKPTIGKQEKWGSDGPTEGPTEGHPLENAGM